MGLIGRGIVALFVALVLLTPGQAGAVPGGNYEGKIDPFLKLQLEDAAGPWRDQSTAEAGMIEVILRARENITASLQARGATVRTVLGDGAIITADVPIAAIPALAGDPRIEIVEASKPVFPDESIPGSIAQPLSAYLEVSLGETKVTQAWALTDPAGAPLKGKGVLVAVMDSGIDWAHADFKDAAGRSRVLWLWDQTATGTGPPGTAYNYGIECSQAQINGGSCAQKDTVGHGTHVASTAAGNGLSTLPPKHIGVAPEADLIVVKRANPSAKIIDGWKYITEKAASLGKPVVINNSWGNHFGARDGSDSLEVAIDQLTGAGKIFVKSAGNTGGQAFHARGAVLQGGKSNVTFAFPNPSRLRFSNVVLWYRGGDSLGISVTTPSGEIFGPVSKGSRATFKSTDTTSVVVDATVAPFSGNGDNFILIALSREATVMSGNWAFVLQGDVVAAGGRFDAWLATGAGSGAGGNEVFTALVSEETTLNVPGTAKKVITVANYVTKRCFTSITRGQLCSRALTTAGIIDPSSSHGPTRDGRQKPDIAAPGALITAALSADSSYTNPSDPLHFFVDPDGKHLALEGTSMSAPHVTGVIALMLQRKPTLAPEEVTAALTGSARSDSFTGAVWNSTWGKGKLDALGAVNKIVAATIAFPAPQPGGPAAGAVLPSLGATLTWTNPPGVSQYHLQVLPANNDGPAINLIRNPETSFTIPPPVLGQGQYVMLPGMTYTWRLRASSATTSLGENDPGWSIWSEARTFRTPVRGSARLTPVGPAVGSTVARSAQALRWDNGDKDVFYYEVQVSGDPSFNTDPKTAISFVWQNLVHGGVGSPLNSWTTPPLAPNGTYHWRVRPRVQGDGTPVAWGPTWSFRTGG